MSNKTSKNAQGVDKDLQVIEATTPELCRIKNTSRIPLFPVIDGVSVHFFPNTEMTLTSEQMESNDIKKHIALNNITLLSVD